MTGYDLPLRIELIILLSVVITLVWTLGELATKSKLLDDGIHVQLPYIPTWRLGYIGLGAIFITACCINAFGFDECFKEGGIYVWAAISIIFTVAWLLRIDNFKTEKEKDDTRI